MSAPPVILMATDVGLWMALPAFVPAFVVAGVVAFVIRRDRRRPPDPLVPEASPSAADGQ